MTPRGRGGGGTPEANAFQEALMRAYPPIHEAFRRTPDPHARIRALLAGEVEDDRLRWLFHMLGGHGTDRVRALLAIGDAANDAAREMAAAPPGGRRFSELVEVVGALVTLAGEMRWAAPPPAARPAGYDWSALHPLLSPPR